MDFSRYIPTQSSDYESRSKGVEGPKPNLTLAKLFGGIADITKEGLKGATDALDINIENTAQQRADEVNPVKDLSPDDAAILGKFKNRAERGGFSSLGGPSEALGSPQASSEGGGATLLPGDTQNSPATPVEVTNGISKLNRLRQQYEEGQGSPTYWLTQQQVIAQQLKQRFPGSEKEVDAALHKATAPANAIRSQIFSDFQAAAGAQNTAMKDWEHFVRSKGDILGRDGVAAALQPGVFQDKTKQFAITANIAQQEKYVKDISTRDAEIKLKLAQNTLTSQDAEHGFIMDGQAIMGKIFTGADSPLGGLQSKIDAQLAKGHPDEQFLLGAQSLLTQLRRGAEAEVDKLGTWYSPTIKDPTKIAALRKQIMEPFDRVEAALGTGNLTLANWHAENIKRRTEAGTSQLIELDPVAAWMAANKSIGDQNLITEMLRSQQMNIYDKDGKTVIGKESALGRYWNNSMTIFNGNAAGRVNPDAHIGEITRPRPDAPGLTKTPPAPVIKQSISNLTTILTSPESSSEAKGNAIDYITRDTQGAFFKQLDKESQSQALNTLTAPKVAKSIFELNDPAKWDGFKNWAQRTANTQLQARAGDIKTLAGNTKLGFSYDPSTNQLVWSNYNTNLDVNYPELQTATQINNTLRNLGEMYKLDKSDVSSKVGPVLKGLGVSIVNPKEAPAGTKATPYAAEKQTPEALQAIDNVLRTNLEPGKADSHVTGMSPELKTGLAAMLKDAPEGVEIFSGHRSEERQKELFEAAVKKYGSVEKARRWVAPPGHSMHQTGNAADLRFASAEARDWMHTNAKKYGLHFPLGNEPWHIEPVGARK